MPNEHSQNVANDITVQILTQTSENVQKLFDLSIRIDERVKNMQSVHEDFDDRLNNLLRSQAETMQKLAILETKSFKAEVDECLKGVRDLDKRMTAVESSSKGFENKWQELVKFVIQLVWIVIAAWALYKFGLNPPPVP